MLNLDQCYASGKYCIRKYKKIQQDISLQQQETRGDPKIPLAATGFEMTQNYYMNRGQLILYLRWHANFLPPYWLGISADSNGT